MATQLKLLSNHAHKCTCQQREQWWGQHWWRGGGGSGSTGGSSGKKPWKKSLCMGGYCWFHGYHPCDDNNTSTTCIFKKDGHKNDATFVNNMGSNNYWPPVHCIIDSQKTHLTFAGKLMPTT
jgi:hypothetical protein